VSRSGGNDCSGDDEPHPASPGRRARTRATGGGVRPTPAARRREPTARIVWASCLHTPTTSTSFSASVVLFASHLAVGMSLARRVSPGAAPSSARGRRRREIAIVGDELLRLEGRAVSEDDAVGWRAYLDDDDQAVTFCPDRAEHEFGEPSALPPLGLKASRVLPGVRQTVCRISSGGRQRLLDHGTCRVSRQRFPSLPWAMQSVRSDGLWSSAEARSGIPGRRMCLSVGPEWAAASRCRRMRW
jgi:hypothetical protein